MSIIWHKLFHFVSIDRKAKGIEIPGVVIYGMMGAGKSETAKALFGLSSLSDKNDLFDTDDMIVGHWGHTPAEIIAGDMEEAHPGVTFQEAQREAIFDYEPEGHEIVATGGSVALDPDLVTYLNKLLIPVWLDVPAEVILAREGMKERVGALVNPDGLSFTEVCEQRRAAYKQAVANGGVIISVTASHEPSGVALEITEQITEQQLN